MITVSVVDGPREFVLRPSSRVLRLAAADKKIPAIKVLRQEYQARFGEVLPLKAALDAIRELRGEGFERCRTCHGYGKCSTPALEEPADLVPA